MDDSLVAPELESYLQSLQRGQDKVLSEMGAVGRKRGFPIIGPLVGSLCAQWTRAIGARKVFEMGSGFGYSTYWFAQAVGPTGTVVHTETDPAKQQEAREWLTQGGLVTRVDFRRGDARQVLRKDAGPYDIVFIDIDKEQYPDAWRLARDRVRVGGLVITDNALWQGKVAGKATDAATKGAQQYNELAKADKDFHTTVVPLRDGVSVSLRLR